MSRRRGSPRLRRLRVGVADRSSVGSTFSSIPAINLFSCLSEQSIVGLTLSESKQVPHAFGGFAIARERGQRLIWSRWSCPYGRRQTVGSHQSRSSDRE